MTTLLANLIAAIFPGFTQTKRPKRQELFTFPTKLTEQSLLIKPSYNLRSIQDRSILTPLQVFFIINNLMTLLTVTEEAILGAAINMKTRYRNPFHTPPALLHRR